MAKNAKQENIYPAHRLIKKITKEGYLITTETEADMFEVLVTFIKKTEFIDMELPTFLQLGKDISLDMESLKIHPGIHYKMMAVKRMSDRLKDWLDKEKQSEESVLDMYH